MIPAAYRATTLDGGAVLLRDFLFFGCSKNWPGLPTVERPDDLVCEMGVTEVVLAQSGRWFVGRVFLSSEGKEDGTAELNVYQHEAFREILPAAVVHWFEERHWRIPKAAAASLFKPMETPAEPGPTPKPPAASPTSNAVKSMAEFPQPDFTTVVSRLRRDGRGKPKQAALVEYMSTREEAGVEDIAETVHGDKRTTDQGVRSNIGATNRSLEGMGIPLRFEMKAGRVFRVLPG